MSLTRRSTLVGVATMAAAAHAAVKTPKGPGLIMSEGPAGWWDSERCSCPRVLRNDDGSWSMRYYGRDPSFDDAFTLPTGRIGHARSKDGVTWERMRGPLTMGAVFEASSDPNRFDCGHVGVGGVSRDGDQVFRRRSDRHHHAAQHVEGFSDASRSRHVARWPELDADRRPLSRRDAGCRQAGRIRRRHGRLAAPAEGG
jgi:hypothetical protein